MTTYSSLSARPFTAVSILFVGMVALILASCKKDGVASATPGALSVSTNSFSKPSDVVTFSWTNSTIKNSSTGIGLFLEFGKKGNSFADAANVYLGRDILLKEFTGGAFNDILKNQLQLPSGTSSDLEVRLRSVSSDGTVETFFTNTVDISATPFDPPPYSKLWMVGDATPNGWNIDGPTPMQQDLTDPFVFFYEGQLNAGEFKIPTTTGNWGTDFYMPLTNHQDISLPDVQLVVGGNPDLKWQITVAGNYKITLNLFSETIEIKMQ